MGKMVIHVDNGKYTFRKADDGYSIEISRYGKPWHGPQSEASNALHSMMAELDAARYVLAELQDELETGSVLNERLQRAVDRHRSLVGDPLGPSEWCGTPDEVKP